LDDFPPERILMNILTTKEQAARLARAIVSDVAIYNQEKVESGIKNDNIFDVFLLKRLKKGVSTFIPGLLQSWTRNGCLT
jgi:hypothetical protein